ncbi:hypothetical protein WDV93_12935 [Pantoea ananatis]
MGVYGKVVKRYLYQSDKLKNGTIFIGFGRIITPDNNEDDTATLIYRIACSQF